MTASGTADVGARRESRRFGSQAPDFNPDGTHAIRVIAEHFGLPAALLE